MRICIHGAGAIGGHFAAKLIVAGHKASVVVRRATLQAIWQGGSGSHSDCRNQRP